MFNVNELTARLSQMSDPQLQQYAKLHKNDPYTLALAASESKRRVQLRAAGQQQGAQGPQPTVADQAIAQMGAPAPMPQQAQQMQPRPQLPEQQGIGMLSAENMSGMADGGIAGYADGGMVAFADGDLVRTPEFDLRGGSQTAYGTNTTDVFRPTAAAPAEETSSPIGRFFSQFRAPDALNQYKAQQDKLARERALVDKLQQLEKYGFGQQTQAQQAEAARVRQELNALRSERPSAAAPAAKQPETKAPETKAPETKALETPAPPAKDKGKRGTGPFADSPAGRKAATQQPGAAPVAGFTPTKASSLTDQFNIMKGLMPTGAEYDTLATETEAGFTKRAREREESRPKDKAYTGLETLLGKEEEKAKGKEKQNLNMALINAGLAIAGGKSQYALQNIAEGAQVGTKQYQEGLEKLEAAAVERRKQNAMIEEARRAEARGDWKEAETLKQQAFEAGIGIKRDKIGAIAKITGDSIKAATDRVNTQEQIYSQDMRTIFTQQQETQRAREREAGDLQRARIMASAYGARAADRGAITPALMLKEYNDLLSANPLAKRQYPTFESYMAAIQQASQGGKDPYAGWGNLQVTPGKK